MKLQHKKPEVVMDEKWNLKKSIIKLISRSTTKKGETMKVLLFDIETAPNLSYVWGRFEQDTIEVKRDWHMITFSWKWLGEKKVHALGLPDFKTYKKNQEDDSELVKALWKLFNEADIVVAHNGAEFDVKKSNARFIVAGMKPPRPYKIIDTKMVARKHFKFDSNKLDELGRQLGIGRKMQTGGFELWKGCMAGVRSAWKKMLEYNKQDVVLLEKVYLRLLPWITNFPVVRPEDGECRNCEGTHLQRRGYRYTKSTRIQRLQCVKCGAWNDGKREKL